jgi:hypothetical protein
MFRAVITDVNNPIVSSFVTINGSGMVQTIKFKPNSNLKFSVRLPNGDLYDMLENDTVSPAPPSRMMQISALFKLTQIEE